MKLKKTVAVLLAAVVLSSASVAGCGSSIDADAAAATLDGKDISMGVANFMAQYQAVQMDAYFLSYYGEKMWSQDSGDGTTMTDSLKKSVMEDLQECYLLDAHAADYQVSLTEEEQKAITDAAAKFIADNSGDAAEAMGATQQTVEEMLRLNKIRAKMRTAIGETIDTKVSDEECAQKTFSYVKFEQEQETAADQETAGDTTSDSTSDTTSGDGTDTTADDPAAGDEPQNANTKAMQFLIASANKDMETAAEEGGYTISTCSYGEDDLSEDGNTTGMSLVVLQAADNLKEGKLSESLIEADNAYYAIRMDSTDDKEAAEKKKESILSQRRTDKFNEVLDGYKDECKWKINDSEWKKVNFEELYTIKAPETTTDDAAGGTAADDAAGGTTADDAAGSTAADDGTAGGTAADDAAGNPAADGAAGGTAADDAAGNPAADDSAAGNTAADDAAGNPAADDSAAGNTADGAAGGTATDDATGNTATDDSASGGKKAGKKSGGKKANKKASGKKADNAN